MRRLSALLLLFASATLAQTSRWASADDKTAEWMISQERRWAESACDGNDVVQTLLADDFQGTSPSGKRYSKPTTKEKPSARDCKLGEVKIRFFGDNLAIAYGSESRVKTSADGKDAPETLIWTDTWLRRNGRWQIIAAEDLVAAK
ncbi:MAG TPA: nuclear transport factor 2 family protein [Gemmatimonadales bacterium]